MSLKMLPEDRRFFGVVPAIVVANSHPDGEYRVQVKYPWIRDATDAGDDEDMLSNWCRVSTIMAGVERGFLCLPEVEDEVLVAFEHGNPRRPIVVGSMWNGVDVPPFGGKGKGGTVSRTTPATKSGGGVDLGLGDLLADTTEQTDKKTAKNMARAFHSREGHLLVFDDNKEGDGRKIALVSASGHTIVLEDSTKTIHLFTQGGKEHIALDEDNSEVTIESAAGDINVFCKDGAFNLECKTMVIKAADTIEMTSDSGTTKMKANGFELDGGPSAKMEAGQIDLNP